MSTVIFAGPSIHGLDLSPFGSFEFQAPAAAGDILKAARRGAGAIGLIDGVYDNTPSVWHKEVLYALTNGVSVYGAASMGALRAAECAAFGMIGIGSIFEDYASGARTSDADVALSHAPAELGFRPITLALVDAEATIEAMAAEHPQAGCSALQLSARAIHFSRRTWKTVVQRAGFEGDEASVLIETLRGRQRHRKGSDARLLLETMLDSANKPVETPSWKFQHTVFFKTLEQRLANDG
jgi:hypothetical protein